MHALNDALGRDGVLGRWVLPWLQYPNRALRRIECFEGLHLVLAIVGVHHLVGPGEHRLGLGVPPVDRNTKDREWVPDAEVLRNRRPALVPLVVE